MKFWNRLEQAFKRSGLRFFEKWLDRGIVAPNFINLYEIRHILVIRQHDQLGDFLLSTPVFRALRQFFPQAHIGVIARTYTAELAQHNEYLNEVLVVPEKLLWWTPVKVWRLLRGLRRGWDLTIVLNTVSHSLTSDLLAYFSGARYVLGSEHRVFPGCKRNFFYNLVARYLAPMKPQSERNLDIVRHLGVTTEDSGEIMTLTAMEKEFARQFLRAKNVTDEAVVIAMHPGAGKIHNRWPVEKFAELANLLHRQFNIQMIVTWGPHENELGINLCRRLVFDPIVVHGLSLRQLAAILAECHVFICNDTGVMHLAAAVGTPLVAIFGPTDPHEWKPVGQKFIAVRGDNNDCENVGVQQIFNDVQSLLGNRLTVRREPPDEALSPTAGDWTDEDTQSFLRRFVYKKQN